jgi:hypothetical protein
LNWYCLTLTAEQVAEGKLDECKDAFEKAFAGAKGPRTMALFKREMDGVVTLFFTPVCRDHAADLLAAWGCAACERPSLIDLHLLVGHHEMAYYMP